MEATAKHTNIARRISQSTGTGEGDVKIITSLLVRSNSRGAPWRGKKKEIFSLKKIALSSRKGSFPTVASKVTPQSLFSVRARS